MLIIEVYMKKIFVLSFVVTVVLLSACEKKLDQVPISNAITETFYTQPSDFVQGVNAAYNSLLTYPDRQLNLSETRSDNLYAVSDGGVREWEGINSFHKTISGNSYVSEAWSGNFTGIYRCNQVLEQISLKGDIITDPALKTRLEAETRFLRAFYYFDLVRWFGKVPVTEKTLLANEALEIGRSDVSDVYKLIISDLQFAADKLPETYAGGTGVKGRVTKYAAKGMLALVYMTRSGPTYSIEGPGLGLNEWNQALALLNEIINSKKYTFLAAYKDIFSYTNENNGEVVFDVEYSSGKTPVVGSTFAWVLAPDGWFQSLGKGTQGGLTIRPVSSDLMNAYEASDTRKAFTIQNGYTSSTVTESRPFFKKYVDVSKVPASANRLDWPINFIALRFTDILLLKAECILHGATGTQGDVDAIVDQVRARAGLAPISNVTLARLMEERRKEFAAEGSRWHDLVRSGLVETVMTNWITQEDVGHIMQPFQKNYILYPIPQSELDVKPGLYEQNLGYGSN
jgi:starch-binding outer membrane protein, SusD/RagB family